VTDLRPGEKVIEGAVLDPIKCLCAQLKDGQLLHQEIGDAIQLVAVQYADVHLFRPDVDGFPPTGNPGLHGPTAFDFTRFAEETARFPGNPEPMVVFANNSICNAEEEQEMSQQGVYDSFSGDVIYDIILPGTILCRYAQQAPRGALYPTEPGRFWVRLRSLSLNEGELRVTLALPPSWNQDGILEVAVVPEGGIGGYHGTCASQHTDPSNLASSYLPGGVEQYFIPRVNLGRFDGCIMVIANTKMPISDAHKARARLLNADTIKSLGAPAIKKTPYSGIHPTWV
jgi:hypothetical protein